MHSAIESTGLESRVASQIRAMKAIMAVLVVAGISIASYAIIEAATSGGSGIEAMSAPGGGEPGAPMAPVTVTTTPAAPTTSSTPVTPTLAAPFAWQGPPRYGTRYMVRFTEVEPEAKQLAADVAQALTTYEESDDRMQRLYSIVGASTVEALATATEPLAYSGSWSRGEVLYPQLGGLTDDRASVMVVTRQTVGTESEAQFSVVRTLDIRLIKGDSGWEFHSLESAGGTFDTVEDLALAHEVAADPRIEMPDSARLDIRAGLVSPTLLSLMSELADITPYGVAVLTTGHPIHVFETDRTSHHTLGRAVDIIRIGDRLVIDDRGSRSETRAVVEWLFGHSDVVQVGSPWDLDGEPANRSFTDLVHQDHIHLAVVDG